METEFIRLLRVVGPFFSDTNAPEHVTCATRNRSLAQLKRDTCMFFVLYVKQKWQRSPNNIYLYDFMKVGSTHTS